jgi:hypothetical protein
VGNTKKWKMKDGTKVRIKDMTDSHLLNTLKLLKRYGQAKYNYDLAAVLSCPGFQGEQAQIAFEDAENEILNERDWESYMPPIFEDLTAEAIRRNLEIYSFLWGEK